MFSGNKSLFKPPAWETRFRHGTLTHFRFIGICSIIPSLSYTQWMHLIMLIRDLLPNRFHSLITRNPPCLESWSARDNEILQCYGLYIGRPEKEEIVEIPTHGNSDFPRIPDTEFQPRFKRKVDRCSSESGRLAAEHIFKCMLISFRWWERTKAWTWRPQSVST